MNRIDAIKPKTLLSVILPFATHASILWDFDGVAADTKPLHDAT
jgi:hypothetical protein